MTQRALSSIFGVPLSPVERGTRAGHLQFIEEQVNHAIYAYDNPGAGWRLRSHLVAILGAVRKLREETAA